MLQTVESDGILIEDLVDVLGREVVRQSQQEVESVAVVTLGLGHFTHWPVAPEHHSGHSEHV